MKNSVIITIIVVVIAGLAGLAFFTHLEKPETGTMPQQPALGPDSQAMMEQVNQEIAALKKKVEQNPKDREALIALGNMYYDANMPAGAIEYYSKALEIGPDDANVRTDLGTMYRHNGDLGKAIECYQKATQKDPKNKNAWFNLGIVYKFDKNEPHQAAQAWRKFLELVGPEDPHYQGLKEELSRMEAQGK